jgi:hypothetical protein
MDMVTDATLNPTLDVELDEAPPATAAERRLQELWLGLGARPWRSLVLVPATPVATAAPLASGLAEVGRRLGEAGVAVVVAEVLGYDSTRALLQRLRRAGAGPERLLVAIPPVIVEPLGLAVTRDADAVVIAVERGRTRLADVARTAALVGRDRIAGCVLSG